MKIKFDIFISGPHHTTRRESDRLFAEARMAGHVILDTSGMFHERLFDHFDKECRAARDERKIHSRHAAEAQPRNLRSRQLRGDQRVERLRTYLENGFVDPQGKRIVRSREQRQLHEVYIRTCLPKLYEGEWEDNQERILAQFGITKLQQESLVVMPRRSGKTWSMAMFCAAMLIVCSDIEISVFATGQRTASKLLKLMTKMMTSLLAYVGDDQFKIVQQNKEAVILLGPDKTERTCGCYPGSVTVRVCCFFCGQKFVCAHRRRYVRIFYFFLAGNATTICVPMSSKSMVVASSAKRMRSKPSGTEKSMLLMTTYTRSSKVMPALLIRLFCLLTRLTCMSMFTYSPGATGTLEKGMDKLSTNRSRAKTDLWIARFISFVRQSPAEKICTTKWSSDVKAATSEGIKTVTCAFAGVMNTGSKSSTSLLPRDIVDGNKERPISMIPT